MTKIFRFLQKYLDYPYSCDKCDTCDTHLGHLLDIFPQVPLYRLEVLGRQIVEVRHAAQSLYTHLLDLKIRRRLVRRDVRFSMSTNFREFYSARARAVFLLKTCV